MEKLIELLNKAKPLKKYKEYWYIGNEIYLITYAEDYGASENRNITLNVISKPYGFIKWLVENDKIDHGKLSNYIIDNKFFGDKIAELKEYETLLMLLSISDTPIEDLFLYLK